MRRIGYIEIMARRTTPRPAEEARAIARMLRERFISPEVETVARIALARMAPPPPEPAAPVEPPPAAEASQSRGMSLARSLFRSLGGDKKAPSTEPTESPKTLITMIRKREGIEDPNAPVQFTAEEQQQARQILDEILRRYRTPH